MRIYRVEFNDHNSKGQEIFFASGKDTDEVMKQAVVYKGNKEAGITVSPIKLVRISDLKGKLKFN